MAATTTTEPYSPKISVIDNIVSMISRLLEKSTSEQESYFEDQQYTSMRVRKMVHDHIRMVKASVF